MSAPGRWLTERLALAPPSLRARIVATLPALDERSPAEMLRSAAEMLLSEAVAGPPDGDTALTLLAADALVTLACEYRAEHEPERLADLR